MENENEHNNLVIETGGCYYLCLPMSFLIVIIYGVLGITSLVENFELCTGTSLWWYNLVSFIVMMGTVIYNILWYSVIDNNHIRINGKMYNIVNNFIYFMFYIGLVAWGITQIFYIPKNCFNNNHAIIIFGYVNFILEFIVLLIFFCIFMYLVCLFNSSKIGPQDNLMDNV